MNPELLQPTADELRELATLPAGHPRRRELLVYVQSLPIAERDHWMAVAKEFDDLRGALQEHPALPAHVTARLLAIPELYPRLTFKQKIAREMRSPVGLKHVAALLILGVMVGLVAWEMNKPEVYDALPALTSQQVDRVSALAVATERGLPATRPSTGGAGGASVSAMDVAGFEAAVSGHSLSFTPTLPEPVSEDTKLVDAGVTTLGSAPAVYTRWVRGGESLVLYQFAAKAFALPVQFCRSHTPCSAGGDVHLEMWSARDGASTWALLKSASAEGNPFGN